MIEHPAVQSLLSFPPVVSVGVELLRQANQTDDTAAFLAGAVLLVAAAAESDYVAVVHAPAGRWMVEADAGRQRSLPIDLLAEALDSGAVRTHAEWTAVPLDRRVPRAEALLLAGGRAPFRQQAATALGPVLGECLCALARRSRLGRAHQSRLERLEAIVRIAQHWNQHHQMESLLAEMAEAATRLVGADRASIFLWDRATATLVGRPALGVEGGELRLPDSTGVVGQVIRSGLPRRVDVAVDADPIDHQVDARLGYQTRTLLCVPLRDGRGEIVGAFELLNKHAGAFTDEDEGSLTELANHASIALENAQDRQRLLRTTRQIADQAAERVRLVGPSPAIEAIRSITGRVAKTDLAVLILGENGTGKEVVAQSIHYLSARRDKPFVAVNCAAIPDTLAESELFGHEKGAFTDARQARPGRFELADTGTLFLDEIGDLSLAAQAKLLRVIEEKVLVRLGGSLPIHTDARILAATNQDLGEMVRQKRFRADLYFRLNVVAIEIPPLRERPEDVLPLAEHFLTEFAARARRRVPEFTESARQRLQSYSWPGNVRELRNLMERLTYLSPEDRIDADQLALVLAPWTTPAGTPISEGPLTPLAEATARFQMDHIRRAIGHSGGNLSQAATQLGLHRSNLYRKMRQLGMDAP